MNGNDRQPLDRAAAAPAASGSHGLKMAIEFGPLLVFFLANWKFGIIPATGAFMAATLAAVVASKFYFGRVAIMLMITAIFVIIFGGLTIWLNDDSFIKAKPTIVYGLFAIILLGGLAFGHALLRHLLDEAFSLSEEGWRKLSLRWGLFFIFMAVLNEVVWRNVSGDTWIAFKLFGAIPLVLAFSAAQIGLIKRHWLEPSDSNCND